MKRRWIWWVVGILAALVVLGLWQLATPNSQMNNYYKVNRALAVLKRDPGNFAATIQAGTGYYALRQYSLSIQLYEKAVEINPQADTIWNYLGNAYREATRYGDAERAYNTAIKLQADIPVYYLNLVDLYKRWSFADHTQDIKKALEAGVKATGNDPALVQALEEYEGIVTGE